MFGRLRALTRVLERRDGTRQEIEEGFGSDMMQWFRDNTEGDPIQARGVREPLQAPLLYLKPLHKSRSTCSLFYQLSDLVFCTACALHTRENNGLLLLIKIGLVANFSTRPCRRFSFWRGLGLSRPLQSFIPDLFSGGDSAVVMQPWLSPSKSL